MHLNKITNYEIHLFYFNSHVKLNNSWYKNKELYTGFNHIDFLIKKGVSAARISHVGFGESRPISTNENEKGRTLNRRVEFNLVPKE